jgi:hypothetical protein
MRPRAGRVAEGAVAPPANAVPDKETSHSGEAATANLHGIFKLEYGFTQTVWIEQC